MSVAHHTDVEPKKVGIRNTDVGVHDMDTGVITKCWEVNRWRKYGKDRIYFDDADGYVDVETGAVEEGAPVTRVEVEQIAGETWTVYYRGEEEFDDMLEEPVIALRR